MSLTCFESHGDDSAKTQSSANARDFTGGCPITLIPVILEFIVLEKESNVMLYSIGDKGSPCLSPRDGWMDSMLNRGVLTLMDVFFRNFMT